MRWLDAHVKVHGDHGDTDMATIDLDKMLADPAVDVVAEPAASW